MLDYIGSANPAAHSDPGSKLIALGKTIPGIAFYCPDFRSCAYVALHDEVNRIVALAAGMRDLHFRLPLLEVQTALAAGARRSEIGLEWIATDAFAATVGWDSQLQNWCGAAARSFAQPQA